MNQLIRSLRAGASLPNPTGWKWFGVAMVAGILALRVAQYFGFVTGFSEADIFELVALVGALYTQLATTEKIGLLPKRGSDD